MNFFKPSLLLLLILLMLNGCKKSDSQSEVNSQFISYAEQTLNNTLQLYSVEDETLFRENYPFSESYTRTYLASSDEQLSNQYAYLWPFSGLFSAANAMYKATGDEQYLKLITDKILVGLEEYLDTERHPFGYSSYINRAPLSDRFYDDNIWIGIDFTDLYIRTQNEAYLEKAELVWNFVYSGSDKKLGGGIYWVEQNKGSKHSCSNAPAVVLAAKLYLATQDRDYLEKATFIYNWTKDNLQDKGNLLYNDNIRLDRSVDKKKYSYNSGQMLQAAVLLYTITNNKVYLDDATLLASACYQEFFHSFENEGDTFRILNNRDVWFSAVMARGFVELFKINNDATYVRAIAKSLDYAWRNMRDENKLFGTNWDGTKEEKQEKWILTQAAMIEMYAEFSCVGCK